MELEIVKDKLPISIQELNKYILFNEEKFKHISLQIKTINKLDLGQKVYNQKLEEAQKVGSQVLDAKVKIGELLSNTEFSKGGRGKTGSLGGTSLQDININKKQSHQYQELFRHKDLVEEEKQIAKEKEDLPTTRNVLNKIIERKRQENKEKAKEIELPNNKYNLIYCDPPWEYDLDIAKTREPDNHYPTMNKKELMEFGEKIKKISHKDCVLFMWITAPKLNWLNDILTAWGFEYKTNFIWDKIKHNLGHYGSIRHEILIIAGKGTSTPTCDYKTIQSINSIQRIEKTKEHSEKPEEFRKIIELLYPTSKKIELFSRRENIDGWICWGYKI